VRPLLVPTGREPPPRNLARRGAPSECASCARSSPATEALRSARGCRLGWRGSRGPGYGPFLAGPWLAREVRGKARDPSSADLGCKGGRGSARGGWNLWLFHSEPSAPSEDLLTHLEVLEDIEEEGMEPSQDLSRRSSKPSTSCRNPRWMKCWRRAWRRGPAR